MSVNGQPITSKLRIPQILSTLKAGDAAYIRVIRATSYQINNQGFFIYPPYNELNFEVPIKQCSL
jgi:hypothetical protein